MNNFGADLFPKLAKMKINPEFISTPEDIKLYDNFTLKKITHVSNFLSCFPADK